MLKIIDLNTDKISFIIEKLHNQSVRNIITNKVGNIEQIDFTIDEAGAEAFKLWVVNLPILATLEPKSEPKLLLPHIEWAAKAKWVYSQYLEAMFCPDGGELPLWVNNIYKLGRYAVAAKAMLQLAVKEPSLFTPLHIAAIDAPKQEAFSLGPESAPLLTVIRRLTGGGHDHYISQLGQLWLVEDPETRFRKACRLTLTVHAEMQLLAFYDHHPELTPRLLFMGVSKKTCFLCNKFLARHPLAMSVSSCHQKLYPSWTPAPCTNPSIYNRHSKLIRELSQYLEETTARDLNTRLGILRPRVLDSTAGPSLPGPESLDLGQWDAAT